MNKSPPGEDLPALFRSLRPDNASFQATLDVSAHEAEQRWPLFKAISPKTPELTPALTAEERLQWSFQQKPVHAPRKPALARLGLSDKLTKSLDKMSGLENKPFARAPLAEPVAESKPERTLPRRSKEPAAVKPAEDTVMLFSTPVQAAEPPVEAEVDAVLTTNGLFGKKTTPEITAPKVEPKELPKPADSVAMDVKIPVATDDSLASIFGRLLEKEEVVSQPVVKKSSFLGRLGKR